MTHAFATKDQSAEIVAYHLYNDIISRYGVMDQLFSDRAAAFTGKIMTSLTEIYGIKHVISSSRHAQTQGLVERANQQLVNILRTIGDSASQWKKYLGAINLAMRCDPSKALCGFTSAEAAFGRRLKTPEESLMAPKTNSGFKNVDDFITQLKEKIIPNTVHCIRGAERYLSQMQDQYNKNASSADFEINSYVMIKREYFKIVDHHKLYSR